MRFLAAAIVCGAFAAHAAEKKELIGFDELLPEEPKKEEKPVEPLEPPEPEVIEPLKKVPAPPEARKEPEAAPRRRGLYLAIEAGGFFPVKGAGTDYNGTFSVGARAWKKLNPRMGLALSFCYARPESDRGAPHFFLVHAGLRLRLSGEDIATCPLYAGLAAGFAAEDVTDKILGPLSGNLGPTLSMRLGLRLGPRFDLGLGYVLFPGENAPGAGIVSAGYSF